MSKITREELKRKFNVLGRKYMDLDYENIPVLEAWTEEMRAYLKELKEWKRAQGIEG